MSLPLSMCRVSRAAHGDDKALTLVVELLEQSHFTFCPCKCEEPHGFPNDELQFAAFIGKLSEHPKALASFMRIFYRPPTVSAKKNL